MSSDGGVTWSEARPPCAYEGSGQVDPIIEVVPNTGHEYAVFMIGFNVVFNREHGLVVQRLAQRGDVMGGADRPEDDRPPSGLRRRRPRRQGLIELGAIITFSLLAFSWMMAAYGALGGRASYPFTDSPPCLDAVRDDSLTARAAFGALAVAAFGGAAGAAWVLVARTARAVAARRALRDAIFLVIISIVPVLGGWATMALPYVFALNLRAAGERAPSVRWIAFAFGFLVATAASSFWIDAFGCL